jgi:hypothetical protein
MVVFFVTNPDRNLLSEYQAEDHEVPVATD